MRSQINPKILLLAERIQALPDTPQVEPLMTMLKEAGLTLDDVREHITTNPAGYTRNTVYESDRLEIKLLVWLPGQASPVHNHAGSVCAVQVLGGTATETRFAEEDGGRLVATDWARYGAGAVFGSADQDAHRLGNLEETTLFTLHVYAPPLKTMRVWPEEPRPGDDLLTDAEWQRLWDTTDYPVDRRGRYRPEWRGSLLPNRSASVEGAPDIRDQVSARLKSKGRAGLLLDRFVTWVSGIAATGAEPWFIWTRPTLYTAVLAWLFGGAAASMAIVAWGPLWMLPLLALTLLVTASGARAGMLTIMHDAIHMWSEHPDPAVRRRFWWIGTLMSTLLMVEDFPTYARKHLEHHGEPFATPGDPDVRFIRALGFEPGMSSDALWSRFRRFRWSPWFHWTYLKARLQAQFGRGRWAQRLAVGGFWASVLALVTATGTWLPFLIGWVLPVVLMFQRAALEQFLGEHRWLKRTAPGTPKGFVYAQLSAGRFALDAPPPARWPRWRRLLGWAVWGLRLVLVHAPFRAGVVWGDLAHHDEHHVHGLGMLHERGVALPRYTRPEVAWMNTAYGRRVYQQLRRHDDPALTEFWNRWAALDATFQALSQLDPSEVGEPTDDAQTGGGMLGM